MPWGRVILALLVTVVVLGGMGSLVAFGAGALHPDFSSTLSADDSAALSAPYDDVREGRDADVIARLAGDSANAQAEVDRIQGFLPPGAPTSSRLTTWRANTGTEGNRLWGIREYSYPGHVVRAETALYRATADQPWMIEAFNVNVATHEQLAGRGFNFAQMAQPVQAVVVAAIVLPIFMLITFWAALFQPGLKPRWVWLIAIALGVGTITANTATGGLTFVPVSIQLFGAGATWSGSLFDGWIFNAATPFGAVAYWLSRLFAKPV